MLTAPPHLHTRRPSPTTVEYTVSTSPAPTLSFRLLFLSTLLLRILVGASALLLLYSKWTLSPYSRQDVTVLVAPEPLSLAYIQYLLDTLQVSSVGLTSQRLAGSIPTHILLPAGLLALYLTILRIHTEESLLVLRGLGIQTSTSSGTYLSTAATRFIPTEKIQDVLVNEAFRGFEVRYYLVVVVEGEDEVVVVFPKLLPRRRIVEAVWRGVRGCLNEPSEGKENGKG